MLNPNENLRLGMASLIAAAVLLVAAGVGTVLFVTVDDFLIGDAGAAAENWARYGAENLADIEAIAHGQPASAKNAGVPMSAFAFLHSTMR